MAYRSLEDDSTRQKGVIWHAGGYPASGAVCRCSDRSNFGEPLDCVLVVPTDGGFPCGRSLRGDVVHAVVQSGGVVGQHQVEVGDVDVRFVPVNQPRPDPQLCGYCRGLGSPWTTHV